MSPKKRISWIRLFIAISVLLLFTCGTLLEYIHLKDTLKTLKHTPWFAAYVDVTATPSYTFEQLGSSTTPNVILSFIVSSTKDACTPTWGTVYTLDQANQNIDLDRRIARLRQQGGSVAISFGGLLNHELSIDCDDTEKLFTAYESVVNRYNVDTIDLDLEGTGLTDVDAGERRAKAIAQLQKERRSKKEGLAVWLTLPVTPQGLTTDGTNAVSLMLTNGVDITGINIMTMDYGQSKNQDISMAQASENALNETHRQLDILYQKAGIHLSSETLWGKLGATPMIGQNDVAKEIFILQDATELNTFGTSQGLGRISMWSANRDVQCGDNYVDVKVVSDSCSGIKQNKLEFSTILSKNFSGDFFHNAIQITSGDTDATVQTPDDPAKSPYQIWKESGAYLAGTKVVWHHNVYQAKWWTQGDLPDNPVLQSWQTPWQLVGPVLPGEKPVQQLTLPLGTYPQWDGSTEYDAGDRVLFSGTPYQAKWWNKSESPAAASANADSSPWVSLTQKQVEDILEQIKTATFIKPTVAPSESQNKISTESAKE